MNAKNQEIRISEVVVRAHLDCARKSFLLMFHRDQRKPTEYGVMIGERKSRDVTNYLSKHEIRGALSLDVISGEHHWAAGDISINQIISKRLETENVFFEIVNNKSRIEKLSISPVIFSASHTLRQEERIELAFAAHVLDQIHKTQTLSGKIVLLGGEEKSVRLTDFAQKFHPAIALLNGWLASSQDPPLVVLNKHCAECEFQHLCRPIAESEDSISLLARIGPAELARYTRKGIFTIKQLSFLYRARKRNRRGKTPPVKHLYELQALALRTGNVYLHGDATLIPSASVEIFLDIEVLPETEFHYLIGIVVANQDSLERHQYWADSKADEAAIFAKMIILLNCHPTSPIFHYGNFERVVITKLGKTYDTPIDTILTRLFNVNTCIFGKIYFPVRSNGLKEICNFIGLPWSSPGASGLQSIVWRYRYDETQDEKFCNLLLAYNYEDCENLRLLVVRLREIATNGKHSVDIRFAEIEGGSLSEQASTIVFQFKKLLVSAHGKYEQSKIILKKVSKANSSSVLAGKQAGVLARENARNKHNTRKVDKTIKVRRGRTCPKHPGRLLKPTEIESTRTIIDLIFTPRGVKKVVTRYIGKQGYCSACHSQYSPPAIRRLGSVQNYGHGFQAWVAYHRMALRLPIDKITQLIEDVFFEKISSSQVYALFEQLSRYYVFSENLLLKKILSSAIIHADETTVNILGSSQYIWVITDGTHVVFRHTEGRDATVIHKLLDGYKGVLCSDFYSGYDSVECAQQKCWAHLIRDLNDDLRKSPFDIELETFVSAVRDLIVPIFEATEKYGLKVRNLAKFHKSVDHFYDHQIIGKTYRSDLMITYQKRFLKYRDKLFVFLDRDGVPWNNNMAERALRHIAVQRKISGSFGKGGTLRYLIFLGITQSCRFQEKSLLQFLLSGEKDIDEFKGKGEFVGWRM
ncbi:MAG: IS66 family transposase [Proteobacteria bacterium]|nr:IS66 family transposase [Pseudomonadota bacterium]